MRNQLNYYLLHARALSEKEGVSKKTGSAVQRWRWERTRRHLHHPGFGQTPITRMTVTPAGLNHTSGVLDLFFSR